MPDPRPRRPSPPRKKRTAAEELASGRPTLAVFRHVMEEHGTHLTTHWLPLDTLQARCRATALAYTRAHHLDPNLAHPDAGPLRRALPFIRDFILRGAHVYLGVEAGWRTRKERYPLMNEDQIAQIGRAHV